MPRDLTCFVDANVFLRFFTTDHEDHHRQASRLFRDAAAGKIGLITGPPVLFEIGWTLKSAYDLSRGKILEVLESLLALPGLTIVDADLVERAIATARDSAQDFADAYIHEQAAALGADSIATFNRKHFQKMRLPQYEFQ